MEFRDIDINIPYSVYGILPEDDKFQVDFIVEYSNLEEKDYFSNIPLEGREFGFVKGLMQYFIDGRFDDLMKELFSLPDYDETKVLSAPAWKVILTLKYIATKLNNLLLVESKMLTPMVNDGKYDDFIAQVDFSMFNTEYNQVRELAKGDILKFDEIRKLPYDKCIVELIYIQKQNDLDKLIMKSNRK